MACSGGIDSLSLLHALIQIHPASKLVCAHVNHGWLKEANQAEELLKNFCKQHKITLLVKSYKQGQLKQDEDSGRNARYDFFMRVCKKVKCQHIFIAHNLNDQAETVLFRLFRGTNTNGLTGMPQSRTHADELIIHRPLLTVARSEIEAYAQDHLENYYQDPSNTDEKYHRNLIRKVLAHDARRINPRAEENIVKLAELISEEQDYWERELEANLKALGDLPWQVAKFKTLPRTLQRKILEKVFTPSIRFTDEFLNAIELGGFHRINFEKNKYFTIKQKQIYLE